MKIIEKYTGEKTYMFPNGAIATKEAVLKQFPAALAFAHIVETDEAGEVMFALQNLSAMRTFYKIDPTLSEEEAIAVIKEKVNEEPVVDTTPSAEERIAAALEYQVMTSMPDGEIVEDTTTETTVNESTSEEVTEEPVATKEVSAEENTIKE